MNYHDRDKYNLYMQEYAWRLLQANQVSASDISAVHTVAIQG